MSETEQNYTRRERSPIPSLILAAVCAFCVIVARLPSVSSAVLSHGIAFSFSDIFVILAAGLGGLGCGMLSFVILFVAEFFHINGNFSGIYTLSTYLVLIFVSSKLSHNRMFTGWLRILRSVLVLSLVLSFCWYITFTVLMPAFNISDDNAYLGSAYWRLFLSAIPECAFSVVAVSAFLRFASDKTKLLFGGGWLYTAKFEERLKAGGMRRKHVLGFRVATISMCEAVLLCLVAILFSDIQSSITMGVPFCISVIGSLWRENLQLAITMMCAALPIGYLFNWFILSCVVVPINEMAFVMEQYFDEEGNRRASSLPDLGIKSGDEIEKLYKSLQKMVGDANCYLERMLKAEKKSAHLTQGFMLALAKAVDAKDHYTSGHSERVASYAREIARRMGKSAQEQNEIYTMGLLHDIGKIGVSEAIINKNGKLTDEEFAEIKKHPSKGYEILQNVKELPALATGARWHHERFDGRGYPDGLSGETIPEEARIIAVADAYDAMTSKRAYSDIRPQALVRAEIERCKGSQFDPLIADVMLGMIDDDTEYNMHEGA